jgi:hypothetical protein
LDLKPVALGDHQTGEAGTSGRCDRGRSQRKKQPMNGALAEPLFLLVGRLGVFVPFRSRPAQLHFFVRLGRHAPESRHGSQNWRSRRPRIAVPTYKISEGVPLV